MASTSGAELWSLPEQVLRRRPHPPRPLTALGYSIEKSTQQSIPIGIAVQKKVSDDKSDSMPCVQGRAICSCVVTPAGMGKVYIYPYHFSEPEGTPHGA
jgi:hypothetical protein